MNKEQLLDKLENAIENRECFYMMQDYNMVKAWGEQIEFILNQLYGIQE